MRVGGGTDEGGGGIKLGGVAEMCVGVERGADEGGRAWRGVWGGYEVGRRVGWGVEMRVGGGADEGGGGTGLGGETRTTEMCMGVERRTGGGGGGGSGYKIGRDGGGVCVGGGGDEGGLRV